MTLLFRILFISFLMLPLQLLAAETTSKLTTPSQPAATTTSARVETAPAAPVGATLIEGWQATGHFSVTNQIESRAVSNGMTSDVKFGARPAGGLGVRYGRVQNRTLGFMVGLNYEFNRQVDSINVSNVNSSGNVVMRDKTVRISMFVPEADVTYGFGPRFYGLGGINYPFPQTTEFDDVTFRGEIGTQVGVGTLANDRLHVEVLYRTINLPWYTSNAYSLESKLWGVMLRAGYTL